MVDRHPGHHAGLDLDHLAVGLPLHLVASLQLLLGIHSGLLEHPDRLRSRELLDHLRDAGLDIKTALLGLGLPFLGVAVAIEADDIDD